MIKTVLKNEKVVAGFTTRWGGKSKKPFADFNLAFHVGDNKEIVWQNRNLLAKELRIKMENMTWMNQVHSDKIQVVERGGEVLRTDGLITKRQGLALLVLVADCIPILFYDTRQRIIAVAHAGREGSFQNIAGKMIVRFKKEFNSNPTKIKVFLGPSIQKTCYKVNKEIVKRFKEQWGKRYIYKSQNLNLPLLNRDQLLEEGVLEKNIKISDICTHCNKNYFSYRRQQKTGRFAGVISLY